MDPFDTGSMWASNAGWGGAAPAPRTDYTSLQTMDPLSAGSSLWAAGSLNNPFYAPTKSQNVGSYDPTYGGYSTYEPYSNFTMEMIESGINDWMKSEFPELFNFETGTLNSGGLGTAGDVSRDPSFGRFADDPKVYDEIQVAASKYGVPANLLKVMIARESSGHWGAGVGANGPYDNRAATMIGDGRIVGYTGIKEATATAWGYDFNQLIGNRALQIDAMANGLSRLYQQVGGQYGWDGVISTYYSGDPSQNTDPVEADQYGSTRSYVADVKEWWAGQDGWTQANGGQLWAEGGGGLASPQNSQWTPINRWDGYVQAAATKYSVPANLIKAMMMLETGGTGDPNAISKAGAVGLMQVMPGMHGASTQQLLDPAFNVDKGVSILRNNYDRYGSWDLAAKAYLAGDPYAVDARDAEGSGVVSYWATVDRYWNELDGQVSGGFGEERPPTDPGPITSVSAIWGNQDFSVSQEHGWTEFAAEDPLGFYDYSIGLLGYRGHPGIDVGMPRGTAIYTPVGGTVIVSGNGAYRDAYGGTGEIRIQLDNGHEIIFGHMAGGYVQVGQRVTAGQLIGSSGDLNGEHLHLEYRVPDPSMSSQWRAVDPREALRGAFTGGLSAPTATPGINRPMTYAELLTAAAQGKPVDYGQPLSSGSSWNQWLQQAMSGSIANRRTSTESWAGREQGASGTPALPGFGSFTNPLVQNAVR